MGLGFLSELGWSPNPCRHCTPEADFATLHVRGPGCSLCNQTGYGPQLDILLATADEVFVGGPKGWGKTDGCKIWLLSGNPAKPDGELKRVRLRHRGQEERVILTGDVNYSYVFQPDYAALVTRKTEDDLLSWIDSFKGVAAKMGGRYVGRPDNLFRFPDQDGRIDEGGVIALSHLRDPSSYEKYQGKPQFHRWQPEELAQLSEEDVFESILTCLRTTNENFRVQMLATANPEGQGIVWVANRYVDLRDSRGNPIPPGTLVADTRESLLPPYEPVTRTRIYITGSLLDNPRVDKRYIATLNSISDPRKRRALLLGDWSYAVGDFFPEFRYARLEGEPAAACHVYDPSTVELKPWWRRAIGVDWGYAHNAAVTFGCEDPTIGRLYVDEEYVTRQMGPRKLGVEIAKRALPRLERSPSDTLPLFLSHDAFQKKFEEAGVTRIATLIELGIRSVLGESAISSPELEICDMADAEGLEYSEFIERYVEISKSIYARKRYGIVIFRARIDQANWALLHEMLRWDLDIEREIPEFDWKTWQRLGRDINAQAAIDYAHQFDPKVVTRPELQIANTCKNLIRGFRGARTHPKKPESIDDKHYEGRDSLDSAAHLAGGVNVLRKGREELPFAESWARRVEQFRQANPGSTTGDLHRAAELWESQGFGPPASGAIYGRLRRRASLSQRVH